MSNHEGDTRTSSESFLKFYDRLKRSMKLNRPTIGKGIVLQISDTPETVAYILYETSRCCLPKDPNRIGSYILMGNVLEQAYIWFLNSGIPGSFDNWICGKRRYGGKFHRTWVRSVRRLSELVHKKKYIRLVYVKCSISLLLRYIVILSKHIESDPEQIKFWTMI